MMRMLHACAWVLVFGIAAADGPRAAAPPPQSTPTVEVMPVPSWLAWRVFHDSLAFYRTRMPKDVEQMLAREAGLSQAQAGALFTTGTVFLAALVQIEQQAAAEVQARFGVDAPVPAAAAAPAPGPRPEGRPILLAPGKSLWDMVRESGLQAEVDGQRQSALATHVRQLTQALGADVVRRVQGLIDATVVPAIRVAETRPSPPPVALPPGTVRTPPAGAKIRPTTPSTTR